MSEKVKRLTDIVLLVPGFVIFGGPALAIAALIKLDDGGPIFFLQERVGRDEKTFLIFKFRTMHDGQITRAGAWLRLSGLDEIPQFLNVVKGEMSIVGPRPLTQTDINRLGWTDDETKKRWTVLPGLTGVAQVWGGKGANLSKRLDLSYVQNRCLVLDFKLIALSFIMNVIGKRKVRAYLHARSSQEVL